MPEALRGLRRVSRCQEAVSEGHKRRCGRRCETLGGFQGAKSQFRRVIKTECGQGTRCLLTGRSEAISETFLRLWGGAGGVARPKEGFKVTRASFGGSGAERQFRKVIKTKVRPRRQGRWREAA